jgi:hypothetical protein
MNQKFAFILDNKVEMVMAMDELLTSFFNADYYVEDRTEQKRIFGFKHKFYLKIGAEGTDRFTCRSFITSKDKSTADGPRC